MELRKAKREDLEQIMELIDNAKCFLRSQGVDQWQNGYPDKDCLEKDIEKEIGYLCMLDGRPAGYVCIDFNGEPAYNTLSGSWLSSQPYVVLHRLALSPPSGDGALPPLSSRPPKKWLAQKMCTVLKWTQTART